MTSYSIQALEKLVQDGIQTVEFLQQDPENFSKTYGRSAIQKPTTRNRIDAWESLRSDNDNTHNTDKGRDRSETRKNKSESEGASRIDARDGGEGSAKRQITTSGEKSLDYQVWDAQNITRSGGGAWRDSESGLPELGARGNADHDRDQEPQGYNPDGEVDAGEHRQIMIMDHEMSAAETNPDSTSAVNIRNATTDDLQDVFKEGAPKMHRRLRGITTMSTAEEKAGRSSDPVKKGIEENTASTLLGVIPLSGNGAIPNVHQLLLHQPSSDAHAEDAQSCVQDVQQTGFTYQSDSSAHDSQSIEGKIDLVLNQLEVLHKKLDCLPEIKEEIKNINKKITNLSLGLSTVENYIKSMMVIIPGSGKNESNNDKEINPDLRAVIGRDRTRGLKEVQSSKSNLEDLNIDNPYKTGIDSSFIIKELDFKDSNAANFIPRNDKSSYYTIIAMIKDEVSDKVKQQEIIEWVEQTAETMSLDEIYRILRSSFNEISSEDDLED
uniref:Phosphoprotein n=1 Tax=Gerbil paramyxovirus TaxID=2942127 RepID=A0A977IV41_9MONO|nr:phosphoprotein [Gerbil paramyxovirus]